MSVHESAGAFGNPHSVGDVIDCLSQLAEQHGTVSIGDVVDGLGTRTYGPMLIVPALIGLTPIGAIPSMPSLLAVIILIFAVQMLFGSHHFWIPDIIENRAISGDKLATASRKLRPIAKWLDHWFHGRLKILAGGAAMRVAALLVIGLSLAVPPLEFLPFAAAAPMAAIAAFGLALLVRDGALMLAAMLMAAAAFTIGFSMLGAG
ncbi:exopolysaccharide biosynthesis protein [Sphingomicrobium flavum]|uniref:exopolysaccharide biosynthesis protein n=1 Tax=Sphingomicrobium flavum TaxID=1229164 RepID=UPI0021AE2A4E|nr:exopolysaccharide biosynthesis protein [Sphingomicrobium flavum]